MIKIRQEEAPSDASKVGEFNDYLKEFCIGRGEAYSIDELDMQKAFTDNEKTKEFTINEEKIEANPTYFRLVDLSKWLENSKNFKVKRIWVVQRLKDLGGLNITVSVRKIQTRVWMLPAFEKSTEEIDLPSVLTEKEVSREDQVLGGKNEEEEIPF